MADQPPELARDIVIPALGEDALGDPELLAQRLVVRPLVERVGGGIDAAAGRFRFGDAGAAEHDDRMRDVLFAQQRLRLEIIEHQPQPAHVLALQEGEIAVGLAIARAVEDRAEMGRSLRVLRAGFRPLLRQRLVAVVDRCGVFHRIASHPGRRRYEENATAGGSDPQSLPIAGEATRLPRRRACAGSGLPIWAWRCFPSPARPPAPCGSRPVSAGARPYGRTGS